MAKWDEYIGDSQNTPVSVVNENPSDKWSQYSVANQTDVTPFSGAGVSQEESFGNWLKQNYPMGMMGAGAIATGQALLPSVARSVKMLPTAFSDKKSSYLMAKYQQAFVQEHTNQINKFGNDLEKWQAKYPDRSVDLSDFVLDIQANPEQSSQAIRVFKKTPRLEDILKDPSTASSVPLKDSQDIINHLGKYAKNNIDIQEAVNQVKGAQIESFPEMGGTREAYKKFIDPYNKVKKYFRFGQTEKGIKSGFGGSQQREAIKGIIPEEINGMNAFRRAALAKELIQNPLGIVGKMLGTTHGLALGTIDPSFIVTKQAMGADPLQIIEAARTGNPIPYEQVGIPKEYQNQIMNKETLMRLLDRQRLGQKILRGEVI